MLTKVTKSMLTGETDQRLTFMANTYCEYKSCLDHGKISKTEFNQKVEELESIALSIWGTTSLFYSFLNQILK